MSPKTQADRNQYLIDTLISMGVVDKDKDVIPILKVVLLEPVLELNAWLMWLLFVIVVNRTLTRQSRSKTHVAGQDRLITLRMRCYKHRLERMDVQ